MTFTSQLPLKDSERPQERSLGEAVDALKAAFAVKQRRHYDKPPTPHDKANMHRLMGERGD